MILIIIHLNYIVPVLHSGWHTKNKSGSTTTAMKKHVCLILSALILFLFSCQKENNFTSTDKNLNEIQVSSAFNWSTGKTVDVTITGLPTEIPVNSTLIISLRNGSTLYQGSYEMNQSGVIQVTVPDSETQIILKYGSVEHILPVVGNKVDFSFIPLVVD